MQTNTDLHFETQAEEIEFFAQGAQYAPSTAFHSAARLVEREFGGDYRFMALAGSRVHRADTVWLFLVSFSDGSKRLVLADRWGQSWLIPEHQTVVQWLEAERARHLSGD